MLGRYIIRVELVDSSWRVPVYADNLKDALRKAIMRYPDSLEASCGPYYMLPGDITAVHITLTNA